MLRVQSSIRFLSVTKKQHFGRLLYKIDNIIILAGNRKYDINYRFTYNIRKYIKNTQVKLILRLAPFAKLLDTVNTLEIDS